ncbi:MAG TPA: FHA domain-containing protein [Stellaceae bacterium]|nr:FHA domain-containing protein [Stellaceae bacterium]
MDEVIWVEVLSRHRHVVSRQRCTGSLVRIGRAYANDVVIDDPYVAPEHVRILRDASGALAVEDLGTVNGLFADHERRRVSRMLLDDDAVFRIGHTLLRVRGAHYPVAAERAASAQRRRWPTLVGAAVAVLAAAAGMLWLSDYSEPRIANYVVPLMAMAIAIAMWSTVWTVITRIFAGQARFEENLLVGLVGALGFETWYVLSATGAFGFSSLALVNYRYVGFWCIFALVCHAHLRHISPGRSPLREAVVGGMLVLAVAVQVLVQLDPRSGIEQTYVYRLMPPAFRLSPVANEKSFFAAVGKLQDQLDRDRADEP